MSINTTNAILVKETGGPEVMLWEQVELSALKPGKVLIKHSAIGFNLVDTYVRKGLYPSELPYIPGGEATAVIEEISNDVEGYNIGQRFPLRDAAKAHEAAGSAQTVGSTILLVS